jgi:hypothetical protein
MDEYAARSGRALVNRIVLAEEIGRLMTSRARRPPFEHPSCSLYGLAYLVLGDMGLREFRDHRGRRWKVWDVYPRLADRRLDNLGPPPGARERRRLREARINVRARMASGWLAFEAEDGERRRLTPIPVIPDGWESATDAELRTWCRMAEHASRARRLIE